MKKMVFLLMCFVSVSAFSQIKDGFTKSENGVFYKVEKANPNGRAVKQGDIVVCNYSASYGDSLVFSNFNQEPIPTFAVSDQSRAFKGDMIDGLQLMKEGETYSFAFPYDSLAKMQKLPAFFKKGDFGYYTVAISKLMTQEEFQAEQERMIAEQKRISDSLQAIEMQVLVDYVRNNGFSDIATNGVYYKSTQQGNGTKPAQDKKVKVHYVGKFLDGRVFDTSVESVAKESGKYDAMRKYEPLEFTIGKRQMIPGFEEAVKMMSEGEKGVVVIPSRLAYGARPRGEIPSFSTLIFELELVETEK